MHICRRLSILFISLILIIYSIPQNSQAAILADPFKSAEDAYAARISAASGTGTDKTVRSFDVKSPILPAAGNYNYIAVFDTGIDPLILAGILNGYSYDMIGPFSAKTFKIDCDDIAALKGRAGSSLISLEPNTIISSCDEKSKSTAFQSGTRTLTAISSVTYDDPLMIHQWAIDNMDIREAWDITKGSDSVKIAVIDSGIDSGHEDFAGTQILYGWDFLTDDVVRGDPNGHGTAVSGIIAATSGNAKGIAGICADCTILPLRILGYDGSGTSGDAIDAIYTAADLGSDIINMSLGDEEFVQAEDNAIKYALSKGCIIIAAAGNSGDSTYSYPASYNGVISVASHTDLNKRSSFSTFNDKIDVSAPGSLIPILLAGGGYDTGDGTSFAAPQVSGIAALAFSVEPALTSDEFLAAIAETSVDLGYTGKDDEYGNGAIDADNLLSFINGGGVYEPPVLDSQKTVAPRSFTMSDMLYNSYGDYYYDSYIFTPEITGTYTYSAISDGDSDIFVYDNSASNLIASDESEYNFWITMDLVAGKAYEVLIRNYGDYYYYYDTVTFTISYPANITGAGVVISSGGLTDHWSQALSYSAALSGKKAMLVDAKFLNDSYWLNVTDSNGEIIGNWENANNGSYYFTYTGVAGVNQINMDIVSDYSDAEFVIYFEDMSDLTNGNVVTESSVEGDPLTGATFTAPADGIYEFTTDNAAATIEYVDHSTESTINIPSNSCELSLKAGQNIDFYIFSNGAALTQKFSIRKLSDVTTLNSLQADNGTLSPLFKADVTEYALNLGSYKGPLKLSANPTVANSTIEINGIKQKSVDIDPAPGTDTDVRFIVTSEDGLHQSLYTVTVHRPYDGAEYYFTEGGTDSGWIHPDYPIASFYVDYGFGILDFKTSEGSQWALYTDIECKTPVSAQNPGLQTGINNIFLKVTAENGSDTKIWSLIIYMREPDGSSPIKMKVLDVAGNPISSGVTKSDVVILIFGSAPFESDVTLNGAPVLVDLRQGIASEGEYGITINDSADESMTFDFTIDKTAPVVSGVVKGNTYYKPVMPEFNEGTANLDGSAFLNGQQVSEEGSHKLYVFDAAGNSNEIDFVISKRSISFNSNGGSTVSGTRSFVDSLIAEPAAPVKSGYVFGGWFKDQSNVNAWVFSSDKVYSDTALYAKWILQQYTVSFNSMGGSAVAAKTAGSNASVSAPSNPSRYGYVFIGWYTSSSYTTQWIFATDKISGNTTLYAKWMAAAVAAPKALSAGYNSIKLTWSAIAGANGYEIFRASSSTGVYSLIATISSSAAAYSNTGLATGSTYYYKIRAYSFIGATKAYGGYSSVVYAKPVPSTPTALKAVSASYNSIRLTWAAVAGANGYSIYRSTSATGAFTLIATVTTATYTNLSLSTNSAYFYKVNAYRLVGTVKVYGIQAAAVSAKPIPATIVSFTVSRYSSSSIRISWSVISGASGYEIYRSAASAGTYSMIRSQATLYYVNTGLKTGVNYFYKLRAYRLIGTTKIYSLFSAVKYAKPY
ncbi:MAG: S8 family serine peptidase [Saccharofermentanales bacterium]